MPLSVTQLGTRDLLHYLLQAWVGWVLPVYALLGVKSLCKYQRRGPISREGIRFPVRTRATNDIYVY